MTKRRMIDEKIRESQTFSALTYRQRDMWHGLIVLADDQGRLPGAPNFVGSRIWPYDGTPKSEVETDLAALEQAGNIHRYTVDGSCYIQIVNWWKYQQMQWAGPSNHPAPEGWEDRLRYHAHGNKIVTEAWDKEGGFVERIPTKLPRKVGSRLPRAIDEMRGDETREDITGAKSAPEAPEADPVKLLADTFEQASGIRRPLPARDNKKARDQVGILWWNPLREMVRMANGAAVETLTRAVEQMRRDHLTIAAPNSILKVFTSLNGERHSAPIEHKPTGTVYQ